MPGKNLLPEKRASILALSDAGISASAIAKQMKCARSTFCATNQRKAATGSENPKSVRDDPHAFLHAPPASSNVW
jgi:hypothetical protein